MAKEWIELVKQNLKKRMGGILWPHRKIWEKIKNILLGNLKWMEAVFKQLGSPLSNKLCRSLWKEKRLKEMNKAKRVVHLQGCWGSQLKNPVKHQQEDVSEDEMKLVWRGCLWARPFKNVMITVITQNSFQMEGKSFLLSVFKSKINFFFSVSAFLWQKYEGIKGFCNKMISQAKKRGNLLWCSLKHLANLIILS